MVKVELSGGAAVGCEAVPVSLAT